MRKVMIAGLVLTALPRNAAALPHAGSKELRLGGAGPTVLGLMIGDGFRRFEPEDGDGVTIMGIGGGIGYFVTDQAEIGFRLGIGVIDPFIFDQSLTAIGMGPFVKYLYLPGPIGFYAEVSPGFQILDAGESVEIFEFALGAGVEAFVTESWSVRGGFGYQLLIASEEPDTAHVIGVGWGVGTYF